MSDILEAIAKVRLFLQDVTYDDFLNDEKTQFAVIRALEIVGEASKKIPQEVRSQYDDENDRNARYIDSRLFWRGHGSSWKIANKTHEIE